MAIKGNQPDVDGVVHAFESLRQQLDEIESRIRNHASEAAQHGDYDDVREWIGKAEQLARLVTSTDALLVEFAAVFDQTRPPQPPIAAPDPVLQPQSTGGIRLKLHNRDCDAQAIYNTGSVTVLRGSLLAVDERKSLSDVHRNRRRDLRRRGKLAADPSGHGLNLHEDCRFSSPSGAACFVVGYSANGNQAWIVERTGQCLGDWLRPGTA